MRSILFLIVFCIIMAIYGLINYYLGLKGWNSLGKHVPFLSARLYWIIFWLVVLAYPAAQFGEKYLPVSLSRWLMIVGAYWTAAMFYLFVFLAALKLVLLLDNRLGFLPDVVRGTPKAGLAAGSVVVLLVLVILIYGSWNGLNPQVSRYEVEVSKKAGSLKQLHVVMVSDIHLGAIVRTGRLEKLAAIIEELKPDILILAGDIVDQTIEPGEATRLVDIFGRIETKYGIYAVPGNHEYISGFINQTAAYLVKAGVHYLRDGVDFVGDSFYVVGRDDRSGNQFQGGTRRELSDLLAEVNRSQPILLIDHQPVDLDIARKLGVDLQVSGHTHRGQLWPNNFITDRIYENDWGLLKREAYHLIVSSGYGTWGPPIRIGSPAEVVDIRIKFAE